ncbi:hypothetical protein [Jiangella asiatica]|uniref:Uncharacterized protein n=1 Tax=Jiangella asiatica TaxID=2530372 RepID=A0A4R5CIA6_9ACTN|nr:hypothetical protein [Jiangella asiatica]TDD99968.1 hypothetical protein E1269_26860 [Jiangella asiatica]
MTDDFDETLERRLASLGGDLPAAPLPGPAAARGRAASRTRHQVTGGIVAGIAVVGAAVLVIDPGDLRTTSDRTPPISASTPGTTETPLTRPDDLAAALLTAEDLAADDARTAWATAEADADVACDPSAVVDTMSSVTDRAEVAFQAEGVGEIRQDLARLGPDASIQPLFDEMVGCLPDRASGEVPQVVDTLQILEVGDDGWMIRYYADPGDPQADAVTVAATQVSDVLSITTRIEPTENTIGDVDIDTPVRATERVCDVLFGTDCVGDPATAEAGTDSAPTGDPTEAAADPTGDPGGEPDEPTGDPEEPTETETPADLLDLADDPFLTDADLATVGQYTGFTRNPDYEEPAGLGERCIDDLTATDADAALDMNYFQELGEGRMLEYVLRMPDVDSAFRVLAAHTSRPEVCGEVGEQREETVEQPVAVEVDGSDEALSWSVLNSPTPDNPGSEPSFTGNGMARVGNIVVVVSFQAFGDPSDGDWAGLAAQLLGTALERAVR